MPAENNQSIEEQIKELSGSYGLDPILSIKTTCFVMNWSRTTHWREVKAKRFPKPVQTSSGRKGHFASTVRAKQRELKKAHGLDTELT